MAAPASVALFTERLYALGAEAEELATYANSPVGTITAADRERLKQVERLLKRFIRDCVRGGERGFGVTNEVAATQFAARTATEKAAHFVAEIATTLTTPAAATVITACLVGQTETQMTSSVNAGLLAHANSASVTEISVG